MPNIRNPSIGNQNDVANTNEQSTYEDFALYLYNTHMNNAQQTSGRDNNVQAWPGYFNCNPKNFDCDKHKELLGKLSYRYKGLKTRMEKLLGR